jgi:hypothetical protein
MHSRKKVDADPIWKYEELPPAALIKSLHLEPTVIEGRNWKLRYVSFDNA